MLLKQTKIAYIREKTDVPFRILPELGEPSEQALKQISSEVRTVLPIGFFDDLGFVYGEYREKQNKNTRNSLRVKDYWQKYGHSHSYLYNGGVCLQIPLSAF